MGLSLTCTCSHLRTDHDGGKKALNDRRIGVCNHQGCQCKEYWADQKSRKQKDQIMLSACVIPLMIVTVCIFGFFIGWLSIDLMLENYNITDEFEIIKFQDGVEVPPNENYIKDPKGRLSFLLKEMIGMIFLAVAMFGSIFTGMYYYEKKVNDLIRGDEN